MARELKFIDSLGLDLVNKAEDQIKTNLLYEFYLEIDEDDDLLGDRKFACASDIKEIQNAFNKFYNLKPTDGEYID